MLFFRKYIFSGMLFCFLVACGQAKRTNTTMRPIDNFYNSLKPITYKSMPQYYIRANQSGCYYELYVNGIIVFSHFENVGLMNQQVPINDNLLQSGLQNIKVKLYPLGKIGEQEYNTLTENSSIEIDVLKLDKATPAFKEYETVKNYTITNFDDSDHDITLQGLPYYEYVFTFNATVPYTLKGWSESQDLTKTDREELEKEIIAFYNSFGDIIYRQDAKAWIELVKNREKDFFQSVAYNDISDNDVTQRIKEYRAIFNSQFKKKEPLDKYKVLFGSGGKTVTLQSIERKGRAAFSFGADTEDHNGEKTPTRYSNYLYLHKPKGSNKLEIIR